MLELIPVHTERFSSEHLLMRAVDGVPGNVAYNVGSPTLQKSRTPIALIPHSKEYDHIAIENTGFVSSMQSHITIKALNGKIHKLFVSRIFDRSPFAN